MTKSPTNTVSLPGTGIATLAGLASSNSASAAGITSTITGIEKAVGATVGILAAGQVSLPLAGVLAGVLLITKTIAQLVVDNLVLHSLLLDVLNIVINCYYVNNLIQKRSDIISIFIFNKDRFQKLIHNENDKLLFNELLLEAEYNKSFNIRDEYAKIFKSLSGKLKEQVGTLDPNTVKSRIIEQDLEISKIEKAISEIKNAMLDYNNKQKTNNSSEEYTKKQKELKEKKKNYKEIKNKRILSTKMKLDSIKPLLERYIDIQHNNKDKLINKFTPYLINKENSIMWKLGLNEDIKERLYSKITTLSKLILAICTDDIINLLKNEDEIKTTGFIKLIEDESNKRKNEYFGKISRGINRTVAAKYLQGEHLGKPLEKINGYAIPRKP
jgi:hypothetical protein